MSSLLRRDPFSDVLPVERNLIRLLDDAWVSPFMRGGGLDMALDMYETDDDLVIKVSVPGVKSEDVELTAVGNTITIKAESHEEKKVDEKNYYLRERRVGQAQRVVTLPAGVRADKATAEFENGVLTLTIPKAEEGKRKAIQVKAK